MKERHSLWLTSVVDSCDGVSVEHAVEEGVGVFRELEDDKKRGIKYSSQTAAQRTHIHTRTHPYTHTGKTQKNTCSPRTETVLFVLYRKTLI